MIEAKDNPQLNDIFMALVVMSKEQGESTARGVSIIAHLERINGTNDRQDLDIQMLKTADAITKASTVKFRWFLTILISSVAIAATVWVALS